MNCVFRKYSSSHLPLTVFFGKKHVLWFFGGHLHRNTRFVCVYSLKLLGWCRIPEADTRGINICTFSTQLGKIDNLWIYEGDPDKNVRVWSTTLKMSGMSDSNLGGWHTETHVFPSLCDQIYEGDKPKVSKNLQKKEKSNFFMKNMSFFEFCEGHTEFKSWKMRILGYFGILKSPKSSIFEHQKEVLKLHQIDHIWSHRFFFPYRFR